MLESYYFLLGFCFRKRGEKKQYSQCGPYWGDSRKAGSNHLYVGIDEHARHVLEALSYLIVMATTWGLALVPCFRWGTEAQIG